MTSLSDTVTVPSGCYTPKVTKRISVLRQERWALLALFAEKTGTSWYKTAEYHEKRHRLSALNCELYELTQNPIYHV